MRVQRWAVVAATAALVLACDEQIADLSGEALRDAGELLADAGAMLSDAGSDAAHADGLPEVEAFDVLCAETAVKLDERPETDYYLESAYHFARAEVDTTRVVRVDALLCERDFDVTRSAMQTCPPGFTCTGQPFGGASCKVVSTAEIAPTFVRVDCGYTESGRNGYRISGSTYRTAHIVVTRR